MADLFHPARQPRKPKITPPAVKSSTLTGAPSFTNPAYKPLASAIQSEQAQAPASAGPAPLPVDAAYDQQVAGLQKQRDAAAGALTAQRQQALLNYGFTEDPSSGALAFDPTNPYSQAALMQQHYNQARKAAGNQLAAQGQLYSGAYVNAQDAVSRDQGQASDSLQKALLGFLSNNSAQQAGLEPAYEQGVAQAMGDAISRAPSNPAYSPALAAAASTAAPALAGYATRPAAGGEWHIYPPSIKYPNGRKVFVKK